MTLQEIKTAIDGLEQWEQHQLYVHLRNLTMDDWDRQMEADCLSGGKLEALFEQARLDYRQGKCRPFP